MKHQLNPFIRYPLYPSPPSLWERLVVRLGFGFGKCLVCGTWTLLHSVHKDNLRETCICNTCSCTNRQRQMAYVTLHAVRSRTQQPLASLKDVAQVGNIVIYNTEARGPIHEALKAAPGYMCSFYFGPDYQGGTYVGDYMHQDLMDLSFENESIDVVLSSDVFEHIADPYKAHTEVYRVLKTGGTHVFTVPFHQTSFVDDRRAMIDQQGELVHLKEPIFHGDPVSLTPQGALVFNIFALEMLTRLGEIGFRTNLFYLKLPRFGIFGHNAIVFEAIKE